MLLLDRFEEKLIQNWFIVVFCYGKNLKMCAAIFFWRWPCERRLSGKIMKFTGAKIRAWNSIFASSSQHFIFRKFTHRKNNKNRKISGLSLNLNKYRVTHFYIFACGKFTEEQKKWRAERKEVIANGIKRFFLLYLVRGCLKIFFQFFVLNIFFFLIFILLPKCSLKRTI